MKVGAPDTTATAGAPKSRKNSNQIIPRQSPVPSLKARMNRVNVPLSFLRRGNVLAANAMGLIFTSSAGGLIFLLTVYLQQILNFSAPAAGVAFLPTGPDILLRWRMGVIMAHESYRHEASPHTFNGTRHRWLCIIDPDYRCQWLFRHTARTRSLVARSQHRLCSTEHRRR